MYTLTKNFNMYTLTNKLCNCILSGWMKTWKTLTLRKYLQNIE